MSSDMTDKLIDALHVGCPHWRPGTRLAHTTGVAVTGTFRGSPEAQKYCQSQIFDQTWTPVTVRFSNSSGTPDPAWWPQIRGMAVKFVLNDGSNGQPREEADMIGINLPVFMVSTPEAMVGFGEAMLPTPVHKPSLWERFKGLLQLNPVTMPPKGVTESGTPGILDFAKTYSPSHAAVAQFGIMSQLPPPESFARQMYHSIHAVQVEGADGAKRFVRFTFEPSEGVRQGDGDDDTTDRYLSNELHARVKQAPVHFTVRMQIADPWDDVSDPTKAWPSNRQQIMMGTLELTEMCSEETAEKLSYNPGRLPEFIEPSGDEILQARVGVYNKMQVERGADIDAPVQLLDEK